MKNNKNFLNKNKKIIIVFFVILIVFLFIVYFLFFKNKMGLTTNNSNLKSGSSFSFKNFFNTAVPSDNLEEKTNPDSPVQYVKLPVLKKIWNDPVSGYGFSYKFNKYIPKDEYDQTTSSTSSILIFVDSKTGFIYEKDLSYPTSTPYQLTSSSYPNIIKAFFINDKNNMASRVIMQYVGTNGTIKTISARIPDYFGSPMKLLNITNLPDNIVSLNISPNNKKGVYVVKRSKITNQRPDSYSDWYLLSSDEDIFGEKVFTSELSYFNAFITDSKEIYAYQKPTSFLINTLFRLKKDFSGLENVFAGHNGGGFLFGKYVNLASFFTGNGINLFATNSTPPKSDDDISNTNLKTLAEKCAISQNMAICGVPKEVINYDYNLPDAWYQGMTTWYDNLYILNNDYDWKLLFDFKKDGDVYDIIDVKNMKITEEEDYLIFTNKNDGSLWSLSLGDILNNYAE